MNVLVRCGHVTHVRQDNRPVLIQLEIHVSADPIPSETNAYDVLGVVLQGEEATASLLWLAVRQHVDKHIICQPLRHADAWLGRELIQKLSQNVAAMPTESMERSQDRRARMPENCKHKKATDTSPIL